MPRGRAKPVAHCIAVKKKAIRVQLPGGDMYAPAFDQAASKTGARSGLATKHATALKQMVAASVAVLNSGDAAMVTLEMVLHDDSISAKLTGNGCTSPTKRLTKELQTLADKRSSAFDTKNSAAALTISFIV
jgi:hypothetical protein